MSAATRGDEVSLIDFALSSFTHRLALASHTPSMVLEKEPLFTKWAESEAPASPQPNSFVAHRTSLRLKEELKTEKKSGFWDNLVLKPNTQSKKPDEIEGWEPPKLALEDVAAESGPLSDQAPRPGWEEGAKGSSKYTSLAGPGGSSRWSLRSAGRLVSIRRQSRGHLTESWEELE